jgi:hypothetical protein
MSMLEEQNTPEEIYSLISRKHSGLAVSSVTPSLKKGNGGGNEFINKELFVDERKPSSMTISDGMFIPKTHLNNC